jgi:hypothetical protein
VVQKKGKKKEKKMEKPLFVFLPIRHRYPHKRKAARIRLYVKVWKD